MDDDGIEAEARANIAARQRAALVEAKERELLEAERRAAERAARKPYNPFLGILFFVGGLTTLVMIGRMMM